MNDILPPRRPGMPPSPTRPLRPTVSQPVQQRPIRPTVATTTPPKRPLSPHVPLKTNQKPEEPLLEAPKIPLRIEGSHKKKRSLVKVIAWIFGALVLVALIAFGIAFWWYTNALKPVSGEGANGVRLSIAGGSSPTQIGQLLQEKSLIRSSVAFEIYTRLSNTRSRLQAGTYTLSPSESTEKIVEHITSGNVDTFSITFLPGATLTENRAALIKAGYTDQEVDAALKKTYDSPLFADKPATAGLEGYIYGETYNLPSNASVEAVLKLTFNEFYKKIQDNNLVEGFKKQGLNLYQGITLASIIQREEPNATAQKQVAQVFYSRLAKGMPLGSDVTAYYGADQIGVERSVAVDTPYNTRIHAGLPPGPIATPGLTALQAAAAPADGDYLYFLSGDDNITYFARTDAEHEANKQHCPVKCAIP